jgi:hypothetical protein
MSLDAEHKMIKPGMMEKHVLRQVCLCRVQCHVISRIFLR